MSEARRACQRAMVQPLLYPGGVEAERNSELGIATDTNMYLHELDMPMY